MDAHALTINSVRDGQDCTLILRGDLDLLETGRFLELHLISLYEIGGIEAVPHLPLRASPAHQGASPLYGRGTP
jgi:hypothetical protein